MCKRVLSLLLSLMLMLCIPFGVFATQVQDEQAEEEPVLRESLTITTAKDFLDFAEKCRLDTYSQHLDVKLAGDISLAGLEFTGVPMFSGTFDGCGYTISGLSIDAEGSVMGLFRYLTETAQVKRLQIKGSVCPQGSRGTVGALAGSNAGSIENCSFTGQVSGGDVVGGLVGENLVTGTVDACTVEGEVFGNHFVGGIVGNNRGVIRRSSNFAQVNTTPQQNTVEISDITLDSLTNTESANTVTDVGGITGTHSGVLRDCVNHGDVGYHLMGYNIGGITGTQSGYITDCENRGSISGRKEVGGIAGQVEPVAKLEFAEDTLQILRGQLDTMSALTNQTAANAQNGANNVTNQITVLQSQVEDAMDAVEALIPEEEPDPENPEEFLPLLPDEDALLAAQNDLSSALSGMQTSLSNIATGMQSTVGHLSSDLQAVSGQVNLMSQTVGNASENIGGTLMDVSDGDTPENLTGKIEKCVNLGAVLGDLNVGGIVGIIATETDLDSQEDVEVYGDSSLNFQGELRAVILNCRNEATVTGKKQYVGGIAGWMQLGLVKNCESYGPVVGNDADYVGGIAGQSSSFIRNCSANTAVSGKMYVGGIAGTGTEVSDCRAIVKLTAVEKQGFILGETMDADVDMPVLHNVYLPVEQDLGGIDGISYDGCAQMLSAKDFFAQEELPERFRQVIVTFQFEDGSVQTVILKPGEQLRQEDIPPLPEKPEHTAYWKDLTQEIPFDTTFYAAYDPHATTLASTQQRKSGLPVLLAEGSFKPEQVLELTQLQPELPLDKGQVLVEAWSFADQQQIRLRYQLPQDMDAQQVQVRLLKENGWEMAEVTLSGRYLVVDAQGAQGICLVQLPKDYTMVWVYAGGGGLILLVGILLLLGRRKKKKAMPQVTQA